jgi:hypothetical protein
MSDASTLTPRLPRLDDLISESESMSRETSAQDALMTLARPLLMVSRAGVLASPLVAWCGCH